MYTIYVCYVRQYGSCGAEWYFMCLAFVCLGTWHRKMHSTSLLPHTTHTHTQKPHTISVRAVLCGAQLRAVAGGSSAPSFRMCYAVKTSIFYDRLKRERAIAGSGSSSNGLKKETDWRKIIWYFTSTAPTPTLLLLLLLQPKNTKGCLMGNTRHTNTHRFQCVHYCNEAATRRGMVVMGGCALIRLSKHMRR